MKRIALLCLIVFITIGFSIQYKMRSEDMDDSTVITKTFTFSKPKATYSVDVDLNTVDVTVFDSMGKHMTDLAPSDFELYVDGEPQKIAAVDYVDHLKEKTKKDAEPAEIVTTEYERVSVAKKEPRYFIFMVGNLSINPARKKLVVDKISEFIKNNADGEDYFAVYNLSPDNIKQVVDLTNNSELLIRFLQMYKNNETFMANKFPDLTETYEGLTSNIKATGGGKGVAVDGDRGENYKKEHNMFFVKTYQSLRQFIESFNVIKGKKQFILLTRGLYHWGYSALDPESRHMEVVPHNIMDNIKQLKEELNSSQTSLQLLDVDNQTYDQRTNNARISPFISTAGATGGTYYSRAARTPEAFEKALEDINYRTSFYYYLSFYPKKKYEPGSSIPVSVKVKRDGAQITYRTSIGIPKIYRMMNSDEKLAHLNKTAFSEYDFNDLSLTGDVRTFPSNLAGKSLSLLSLEMPSKEVIHSSNNEPVAHMDISWLIYTEDDKLIKTVSKNIDLNLKQEYEKRNINYIRYYEFILLPPGKYTVRFYVRDSISGKIGTITEKVVLPDLKTKEPAFGSILPLGTTEDVVGISEYVSLPGKNDVKIDPDNPLYYNNDILLHSLHFNVKRNCDVNLFINTYSIQSDDDIKWYLIGEDRLTRNVLTSKIAGKTQHLNQTTGMLFKVNTAGIMNGNYIIQAEYRTPAGKIFLSECPMSIKR